jgi:hypothetical protein
MSDSKEREKYKRHKIERMAKNKNKRRNERGEAARLRSEVNLVKLVVVKGLGRVAVSPVRSRRSMRPEPEPD